MTPDERIRAFLARKEVKPGTSRLEPYTEAIRVLRKRHWTYQQIADALLEEFNVSVAPSTIHAFLKVRRQRARTSQGDEAPLPTPSADLAKAPPRRRFHLDE
ncbi:MAG: helix-turn-helix domain-containing protein [Verrucomicrobia bacterium]|nr:helix-turn-helix domain-containing protein [Verrucomicrobiota bacterium]